MRAEFYRWVFCLSGVMALCGAQGQTNGIFADFTTSMGNFTCQLSYSNAPKAVANFIGLATGQQPWLDLTTGETRTNAFYDGLIFHRVVSNFVVQAGSPNGLGTDGPGYNFIDEFSSLLNFNSPWVLGLANSGPDSNGSQFFITVAPFTVGNNRYVVFGRVVSGTNVVAAINHVPTGANDKPLTNIYIQQVTIRRVGTAALAFDINAQHLPLVTNVPLTIGSSGGSVSLGFTNHIYCENQLFSSSNLNSWTGKSLGFELSAPTWNSTNAVTDAPQKFFRWAQVQYPSSTLAPKNVYGRTIVMTFSGGLGTNTIVFNSSGGGTYNLSGNSPGTLKSYTWIQKAYNGLLSPIQFSGLYDMDLQLNFGTSATGTFSGTVYAFPPFSVFGTFKVSAP